MFRMLESILIKNRGDKMKLTIAVLLISIAILTLSPLKAASQYYYVNVYGEAGENNIADIYVKSIDLNSLSVIESIRLNNRGNLWSKTPASIQLNNRNYLISVSEFGGIGRNTFSSDRYKVFYSVIRAENGHLMHLQSDSLTGAMIDVFRQYQGEGGFRFGLRNDRDTTALLPIGLYDFDNGLNFRLLSRLDTMDEPGLIRNVGTFDHLIKIPFDSSYRLYYTIYTDSQRWLVKSSRDLAAVEDSLQLSPHRGANTIFAYHPARGRFYCLHVNYELHEAYTDSVYKSREEHYISPEVLIYDPQTFALLERHPIVDYPEGQYPGYDDGLADVVGDFIVYYFFQEENTEYFLPAMLFIFDTRTNETTWLRVGWR